jgi:preprotein translocase subunit SecG
MTKRTLLIVLVAAALLVIGALAHSGKGDGALASWFQRIHGH